MEATRVRRRICLLRSLAKVGGSRTFAHGFGEGEDGEALGEIGLHPAGRFGSGGGVFFHGGGKFGLGVGQILGVEDGAEVGSDLFFEVLPGHVGLGVLLEMGNGSGSKEPRDRRRSRQS